MASSGARNLAAYGRTWLDVARTLIESKRYRSRPSVWTVRRELVKHGCPPEAAKRYALVAVEKADNG